MAALLAGVFVFGMLVMVGLGIMEHRFILPSGVGVAYHRAAWGQPFADQLRGAALPGGVVPTGGPVPDLT